MPHPLCHQEATLGNPLPLLALAFPGLKEFRATLARPAGSLDPCPRSRPSDVLTTLNISWLLFPGVLGLLLFLHRTFVSQKSVEDSSFAPLFSVVVVLWGVAFDKYWSRRSHVLAHAWGTEGATCTQDERRPTFHGTLRTSPVGAACSAGCWLAACFHGSRAPRQRGLVCCPSTSTERDIRTR